MMPESSDFVDLNEAKTFGASDVPVEAPREEQGETNGYDELHALFNLPLGESRQGSFDGFEEKMVR
jgi:hypothetical protein